VDYFQSLSRKARLITPIGEQPRAIATTLEVIVTGGMSTVPPDRSAVLCGWTQQG